QRLAPAGLGPDAVRLARRQRQWLPPAEPSVRCASRSGTDVSEGGEGALASPGEEPPREGECYIPGGALAVEGVAAYALPMKHDQPPPMIYQLRIVLRDISPLIWRRLLVHSDTTLAYLHDMLQLLFAWSDEHLHHFHIFGKDYGSNAADTRHVTLQSFAFQPGERFRYVYNYYAQWQCDI